MLNIYLYLSSRALRTHINSLRPFVALVVVRTCCVSSLLSHTLLAGNRRTRYHVDNNDIVIVGHKYVECKEYVKSQTYFLLEVWSLHLPVVEEAVNETPGEYL